jgi:PAS domain S-box-containing protein
VTENKPIEQALRECEEKFSKAFRQSPLALMLTSADSHRYLDVNETFERLTGWRRDEVIGRTPFDIEIWVNPSQRLDFVKTLLSGGVVRDLEIRVRMKNGEVRTGLGSAELIEINGEQCVLGVAALTDLKPAQEAEQLADRLSSMVRKLIQAHDEERTAIAQQLHDYIDRLILLSADLDRFRQGRHGQVGDGSQEVGGARQQLEDLVSDIQTLSHRLHNSKLEYVGLTAAAANFCKELSDQKQLEISFISEGIPEELPKEISFCLFHVLREALQNATEHSGSRKFQVSLNAESDEIRLTVRDSGVGFDPEKALVGPGLGLDLMKERLKLVDGDLSIESQRGRGTTIQARVLLTPRIKSAQA